MGFNLTTARVAAALAVGGLALAGGESRAQDAGPIAPPAAAADSGNVTVYDAAFFAPFLPNNAQDMIFKLPGFTFNGGDSVRGFAGAAGNVLIDGVRPSSKSVSLDQLLQRLASKNVLRIEIIRGGAPGIDMQGLPVVANVVRVPGGEATTSIQSLHKFYTDSMQGWVPRVEQSWRRGRFSVETQLQMRLEKVTDDGEGRLTRLGPSTSEAGRFDADVYWRVFQGNTTFEYRLRNNDLMHLTVGAERVDTARTESGFPVVLSTGQLFSERTRIKLRNDKAELSGDYTHVFKPWLSGQFVALKTLKRDVQSSYLDGRNTPQSSLERADTSEAIARASLVATPNARVRLEAGAEGALNSLDSRQRLTVAGSPVVLPSAEVRVEEKRAEGFVTLNYRPPGRMALELGVRHEISRISQTGGANQSRFLSYFKPRAILTYDPTSSSQIRLRVQRVIGQLNFKDFAASSALDAGTVNAGNPNLLPEQAWVFEAALEKRFWGSGSIVITASHQALNEVADLIPVRGFDAPGNIGKGERQELRANITLPLDKLGAKGVLIRFNGTLRQSRVTDPVTGVRRRISGQRPLDGDFYIGKQLPKLKSSISIDGSLGYYETFYRISEIRRNTEHPLLKVYWDWAPQPGFTVRFQAENFNAKDRKRHRTLFNGPRSGDQAIVREERYAEFAPFLMIRLRKTF